MLLRGALDLDRLEESLSRLVDRHEILRTTFRTLAGRNAPVQVIHGAVGPDRVLSGHLDLRALEPALAERELEALRRDELAGLDPGEGPTFRAAHVWLGDQRSLLVLTAHALCADRGSLRALVSQLAAEYAGGDAEPAPVHYADFAAWHSDLLRDAELAPETAYWRPHLEPELLARAGALALCADAEPGGEATVAVALDSERWARLERLATAHELEPQAVVATLWGLLLWRLGGGQDVVVGVRAPGRSYQELEGAVGPFERDLPVVCRFGDDAPLAATATRVQQVVREAAEHADYLDPALLDGAGPGAGALPLAFEHWPPPPTTGAPGLRMELVREESRTDATTLRLLCEPQAKGGLRLALRHDEGKIPRREAVRLLDGLAVLLEEAAGDLRAPVGSITGVGPAQRERMRREAARATAPYPRDARVEQLFRQQVRRTPGNVAVAHDGGVLTYAALDARSNQLARHLRRLGVGAGALLPVYAERSPELVVALLGVLKAGAAYVPVDAGQPAERLAFVLQDTAAPLLLTQRRLASRLPARLPRVVHLDDWSTIGAEPDGEPRARGGAGGLAYVIYTSGTTGAPNGVMVPHRALVNYLWWCKDAYELQRGSGSLVHSSIGFDLTVTSLLAPLLVGQRVTLVREEPGVAALAAALRSGRDWSLVKLTPTHLQVLNQLLRPEELAGRIRTLVVGGEDLRAETLEPVRGGSPSTRIVNEYGPTETVVGSSAYVVGAATPARGRVPIGGPIANTRLYLLDERRQPVMDGLPGELYIGGDGVTDGYLRRPELTRERFVPDPFGPDPSARLYRTGDLARRLPDGELEFLGRVDLQVKIRGVRVEPEEVAAVLRGHPGVAAAAVVARREEDPGRSSPLLGETRLLAYVVPRRNGDGSDPSAEELLGFCRQRLPEPLLPAALLLIDALPLTANGKLDRAALPRPDVARDAAGEHAPPRTPTEEILAGAIAAVLGLERIGIDDNYFVLGGDSIRSVMVASRAQSRGVDVTVADLHQHPTVRACAAALEAGRAQAEAPRTRPFELVSAQDRARMPADVEDAFPLNLLQEGMIFHRDFAAKSAVYHAIASLRLRAPFDLDVLDSVIRQLVERHPMLRTSFDQTTFSVPLELVHRDFKNPLSYEDLRGLPPDEREARITGWVEREKERGFELDEFPLIRFMAQRLDDETFQFTYGFHHEIVDGWSEALMVTELFSHYFSILFDEPVAIRPPTSTMRDAVALELQALQQRESYEFWTRYLEDATLMRLPRLLSGPRADKGDRAIVRLTVPVRPELSAALKRLALTNAVPLKTVLLAAHMMVMCQYNGHSDTLTYTVTNGRPESADGTTAIGLFVNSLALRLKLNGGSWNDLIAQTLESELASLPYRRLPMAELKRHQGNEPLAETLFFFTDYHVFQVLERWRARGVEHVASELYGESTFPFCAIFRLNRETAQLEVRLEYDTLQFPRVLMDGVSDCYLRVLEAMVADPEGRYETRMLLPERDRERTLVEWSQTAAPVADERRVDELIAERAATRPDAIAVELGDGALSYGGLLRRAERLARRLRRLGVGPETLVGVLSERSIEMTVCILGALRAGGAYVPLDPTLPPERLRAILERAGTPVVLAQPQLAGLLPSSVAVVTVGPDDPAGPAEAPPAATARRAGGAAVGGNAAYAIFTSGSTGEPKGVVVDHRNLAGSTLARRGVYREPVERFLLLSSYAFDSSVAGIFWTLTDGGTLVLPPEGAQLEPASLADLVERHRVTHALGVPSLFAAVLEQAAPGQLASLRVLIAAGEACLADLLEACRRQLPECAFHNEYGPTEATVWSTVWSGTAPAPRPQLPIGRPIANTRAYLLNHHQQPVPVGVAAELHLAGDGISRGYLHRPDLTAASFIPDPFGPVPGARLYRTGDLCRYSLDGDLEFLDRVDNQVKIRGFRVELGEIEAVLDAHPQVQRSVVLAREDAPGARSLAAYVVPRDGAAPTPGELQRHVRDRLPKYMVPSTCTVLDTLPLTATGKVDRASLPAPERQRAERPAAAAAARSETEQFVAGLWCQVLGLDEVGVLEEFFDLGGESLRAMQVVTRTNKVFGTRLSVRALFDAPTVAAFAELVDLARHQAGAVAGGPGEPVPAEAV